MNIPVDALLLLTLMLSSRIIRSLMTDSDFMTRIWKFVPCANVRVANFRIKFSYYYECIVHRFWAARRESKASYYAIMLSSFF